MLSKYHEKIKIIQGWHCGKYLKKMFPTWINTNCKFIMFKLGLIFDITIKKIKFIPWLGINTNLILAEASVRKYKC